MLSRFSRLGAVGTHRTFRLHITAEESLSMTDGFPLPEEFHEKNLLVVIVCVCREVQDTIECTVISSTVIPVPKNAKKLAALPITGLPFYFHDVVVSIIRKHSAITAELDTLRFEASIRCPTAAIHTYCQNRLVPNENAKALYSHINLNEFKFETVESVLFNNGAGDGDEIHFVLPSFSISTLERLYGDQMQETVL